MSGTPPPEGKNSPAELRNTTKGAKGVTKPGPVQTASENRTRREGKVSRSAPPELKRSTVEQRGGKNVVGTSIRRSGRNANRDLGGKKSGGLKKRSHSPSNRDAGRSLKTRKSRSRVTSPEPIVSDASDKSKPDNKKKASQTHITEYYTIRKEKSTYKVIRTLPEDPPGERGSSTLRVWDSEGKRGSSAGVVTTRRTRHIFAE